MKEGRPKEFLFEQIGVQECLMGSRDSESLLRKKLLDARERGRR